MFSCSPTASPAQRSVIGKGNQTGVHKVADDMLQGTLEGGGGPFFRPCGSLTQHSQIGLARFSGDRAITPLAPKSNPLTLDFFENRAGGSRLKRDCILVGIAVVGQYPLMESAVVIKSAKDGAILELSEFSGDCFNATLRAAHFSESVRVYAYEMEHLCEFFSGMAENWKG